jgi:hypothetical protein
MSREEWVVGEIFGGIPITVIPANAGIQGYYSGDPVLK